LVSATLPLLPSRPVVLETRQAVLDNNDLCNQGSILEEEETHKGGLRWSTVLITTLGSWGKPVPRDHGLIGMIGLIRSYSCGSFRMGQNAAVSVYQ
jgi:hypothetical protein